MSDSALSPAALNRRRSAMTGSAMVARLALLAALVCGLPMLGVALAALTGGTETISHLADTVLGRYARTTLMLVVLVSVGTFAIGVGAAWLVTMTRFPGVRFFEIALVLPLAFPAYVLAWPSG